jgi:hypothetical protein
MNPLRDKLPQLKLERLLLNDKVKEILLGYVTGVKDKRFFLNKIVVSNDTVQLAKILRKKAKPVYMAGWKSRTCDTSITIRIYQLGSFFVCDASEAGRDGLVGPFRTCVAAAKSCAGTLSLDFEGIQGTSGYPVVFKSTVSRTGRRFLSDSEADKLFSILSGFSQVVRHTKGIAPEFVWRDVEAMWPFFDPFHDKIGKLTKEFHETHGVRGKRELSLKLKEQLFEKLEKVGYHKAMFGRGAFGLCKLGNSYVMRVGLKTKGNLMPFRGKWVRMCYQQNYGFNTFVFLGGVDMPDKLLPTLVPVWGDSE